MNPVVPDAALNRHHIRRRFERAAATFDGADFVHAATRDALLARINPLLIDATTVLDLGAATGAASPLLAKRFKGARIINVDFAAAMLKTGRERLGWWAKATRRAPAFVQADANALPFANASIDVVFCNLMLPWLSDPTVVLGEVARVLKKGGVFAFATLGPDSLQSLRHAWQQVDNSLHVHRFPDMHDLGDGLVRAGFSDPVLDVDRLSIAYTDTAKLFADLSEAGARNALVGRRQSLTGRSLWQGFKAILEAAKASGQLSVELELVYGHAWGNGPRQDATLFEVSPDTIGRRRR